MSNTIRCKRYGHALAKKTGGGECVCADGECRDRGGPEKKWTDLLGNPGMDQDCLERCATASQCMLTGCWRSLPSPQKTEGK